MKLKFLGGCEEVGRLGMLLKHSGNTMLFDYGMNPDKPPAFPDLAPEVDVTFISHSHLDHTGMVPWLAGRYTSPIAATILTSEIAHVLAKDSLKIAEQEGYEIPFSGQDINALERRWDFFDFGDIWDFKDFEVHFHPAGHIPGATMFEINGGKSMVFTGDINTIDTRLVGPCSPVKCDILVMEGTYSGRLHPHTRAEEEANLKGRIEDTLDRGGRVVLPAFAVGRTQEILLMLADEEYNLWLDGMGGLMTRLMLENPKFIKDEGHLRHALKRVKVVRSPALRGRALKEAEVVITTSGMLDGGPVLAYIPKIKDDKKSSLFLTGFQAPNTNGRMLMERGCIEIDGKTVPINCDTELFDFSAHADHAQLVEFALNCSPDKIVLCHSDDRAPLVEELSGDFEVLTPHTGEEFML